MPDHPIGAFESRPASLAARLIHGARNILTEGGDEIVPEDDAPDWYVRDVIYNRWQGKRFLKGNVVAMVFCATWCAPCRWEVEAWKELHVAYAKKGLRIVGLFLDFPDKIREFMATNKLASSYPCAAVPVEIVLRPCSV